MRTLVTGGTGFLGRHVAAQLRDAGHEVTVLARSPGSGATCLPTGASFAAADVRNAASLEPVLSDVEMVCHAAGIPRCVRANRDLELEMWEANAAGTYNICRAAAHAGVNSVVVVSSVTVYGPGGDPPAREDRACQPQDTYAKSKLRAEEFAAAVSAEFGLRVIVLRLGPLYGPGHAGNVRRLLEAIERRRFYPIGRGENRKCLLHVRDAARACRLAVEGRGESERRFSIYNVAGPQVTLREIVRTAAALLGRPHYRGYFPALPFVLLSRAGLCPRAIERWLADEPVDSTRFRNTFGWRPETGLAEGFRAEAADLRGGFGRVSWAEGMGR